MLVKPAFRRRDVGFGLSRPFGTYLSCGQLTQHFMPGYFRASLRDFFCSAVAAFRTFPFFAWVLLRMGAEQGLKPIVVGRADGTAQAVP
jgi:hypothetical protein